ncbi:MAG: exodeoxyribonuclease VII large subunit [Phycisphaerales bacterium]|jgi:exodeoxyribonuclease VII large subunit|nr:exodeoxyribonuclease VII large subunit [Phycisphaerales bacterium]
MDRIPSRIVANLFSNTEKTSSTSEPPKPLSVSELSQKISDTLEGRIGRVDVTGQINGPKLGNHWYFTLTDGDSKIDCVMWASAVSSLRTGDLSDWMPEQGDKVVVRGRVGHYSKYGKTQIYVDRMKPVGEEKGKLQIEFEKLVKELREKGWFNQEHKKPLPRYPRKIAVITSKTSAAVRDVIETSRQRWPYIELLIVNVPVQGDFAVPKIIEAIHRVDRCASKLEVDAIIVTRGGGSLEELWSFNDRGVVEAAFRCKTPLVSAIGHESDTSIIELVSDLRASTPTQAAMVLVPEADELSQMIEHLKVRLSSFIQRTIERTSSNLKQMQVTLGSKVATNLHSKNTRISSLSEQLVAKRPHSLLQKRQKRLLTLKSKLQTVVTKEMSRCSATIETLNKHLVAIGPTAVLKRGFTITRDKSGKLVRSCRDVKKGQQIQTVLADGTIESKVECTHDG